MQRNEAALLVQRVRNVDRLEWRVFYTSWYYSAGPVSDHLGLGLSRLPPWIRYYF
jgi:hypothetical protein